MPSLIALRAILGTSLGLGTIDLVWLNVALGPAIVDTASASQSVVSAMVETTREPAADVTPTVSPPLALAAVVEPAKSPTTPTEHVYFTAMTTLDTAAHRAPARVVAQAGPDSVIVVEGHADYRGSDTFNRTLSQQRASMVGAELERLGVARSRIRIKYVGEDKVVDKVDLWRDRRVEIQIIGGQQ